MIGNTIDRGLGIPGRLATGFNSAVPREFSQQVGQAVEQTTGSKVAGGVAGFAAAIASPDPIGEARAIKEVGQSAFKGFNDLSTKVLERSLRDKVSVSPQFIRDSIKSADVKEAERKIFEDVLGEYKEGKVPVEEFADKIKLNLIPLKPINLGGLGTRTRYQATNLPQYMRENSINYTERIYESPVKTSAGKVHFGNSSENYFGHTRIEDVVNPASGSFSSVEEALIAGREKGNFTRRILEVQSDLFQRNRLKNEIASTEDFISSKRFKQDSEGVKYGEKIKSELETLSPYNNTFWERLIKEEVKTAAQDGAKKIQLPAGKTALQIEGLGGRTDNNWISSDGVNSLSLENTEMGSVIGNMQDGAEWVVTSVQPTGQFKAVPASYFDKGMEDIREADGLFKVNNFKKGVDVGEIEYGGEKYYFNQDTVRAEGFSMIEGLGVDEANPIYKFYEKDVGKFLRNKYGAELIQDANGSQWWEFSPPKGAKNLPVEAFGVAGAVGGAGLLGSQQSQQDQRTLY